MSWRKLLPYVLVAFAFLVPVSADTQVFAGWLYSGSSLTVESQTFVVYLSTVQNKIVADYGEDALFVSNNTCASTEIAKVCLDNLEFDADKRAHRAYVRGISLTPSFSITRTFDRTEMRVGESVTVDVTIANSGGIGRDIVFNDSFPAELLEITDVDGGKLIGESVVWHDALKGGASHTLSYTLKSRKTFERSFVASLSYRQGDTRKFMYSGEKSLKVLHALDVVSSLGKSSGYVGELLNLTLNVTNRGSRTLTPTVRVMFDDTVAIAKVPLGFSRLDGSSYVWSRTLRKTNASGVNHSDQFVFFFRGTGKGASAVAITASYVDGTETRVLDAVHHTFTVTDKGIIVRDNIGDSTLEARQLKTLRIWVQNLNPFAAVDNIVLNISSDAVHVRDVLVESLAPGEQRKVIEKNFFAPEKDGGYFLKANATYLLPDGQTGNGTFRTTFTVKPVTSFSVAQSLSSATVRSGDEMTVSVSITNSRLTGISRVAVFDNFSSALKVRGLPSSVIAVPASGTVKAYTYVITAPRVSQKTSYQINTTATYSESDAFEYFDEPKAFTVSASSSFTVEPEQFPLTLIRSVVDSAVYRGVPFRVKYVITNPSSEKVARNVVLRTPLQPKVDAVGGEMVQTIAALHPGESVAIVAEEVLRVQESGPLQLAAANVSHENAFGDRFFSASDAVSVTAGNKELTGPAIMVEKKVPATVNNTDRFDITLVVNNTGTEAAAGVLRDGAREWSFVLAPNGSAVRAYSLQLTEPGAVQLPQATASYNVDGTEYLTGSKAPVVAVVNKPLLSLVKKAPETANTVDNFTVELVVSPLTETPLRNITISDPGFTWTLDTLTGEKVYLYSVLHRQLGTLILEPATATYNAGETAFVAISNTPAINVVEKQLVKLVKSSSADNVSAGGSVTVTLTAHNLHTDELAVHLADGERSWELLLQPGVEKSVSYALDIAESGTLPAAVATYAYNNNEITTLSNTPLVLIIRDANIIKEKTQPEESRKPGALSRIVSFLKVVLTWKRG